MTEVNVKIDAELMKIVMSTDPKVIESWFLEEFRKTFTEELKKHIDEEVEKILYGELGREASIIPTSISFADLNAIVQKYNPLNKTTDNILYGLGGFNLDPTPIGLLDFNSMRPSMWVNYSRKPKNHYERMMRRRINS